MFDRELAIKFIGANIQVYGHFDSYSIPNEDEEAIVSTVKITSEDFLKLIYEYYTTKRLNKSYYTGDLDSVKDCAKTKRFIKSRVNEQSYDIGDEWLAEQEFKE